MSTTEQEINELKEKLIEQGFREVPRLLIFQLPNLGTLLVKEVDEETFKKVLLGKDGAQEKEAAGTGCNSINDEGNIAVLKKF
ncbi:MAG: hypothetical protein US81_C0015G0019 [Parcubacteria group bacterium GW2011_GWE2_38_18]|nr:MAG: hypothetical protein US81_C0015G0019 [Parcubacteria group bacterium GW2011_GWE2_38_18]